MICYVMLCYVMLCDAMLCYHITQGAFFFAEATHWTALRMFCQPLNIHCNTNRWQTQHPGSEKDGETSCYRLSCRYCDDMGLCSAATFWFCNICFTTGCPALLWFGDSRLIFRQLLTSGASSQLATCFGLCRTVFISPRVCLPFACQHLRCQRGKVDQLSERGPHGSRLCL